MAYINVDEVYILDNTGLQVDMTTDIPFADAGFTDAQKEQARKNIAAGGTNPNLLDNPWWGSGEVVNQRGATTITLTGNAQYFIDRWTAILYNGACTINLGANGITLSPTLPALGYMRQKLPNGSVLNGKVLTSSVMLSDGTIYSGTLTRAAGTTQVFYNANNLYIALTDAELWYVRVGDTKTIRAVKLELGSVSTLANDVAPDYGTELLKCMRYFIRLTTPTYGCNFGIGRAQSATTCSVFISLPVPLRASPTVSANGIGELQLIGNDGGGNASACSYAGRSESGVNLSFTTSGLTANHLYALVRAGSTSCYIDLSADL